jgi:hypothetical protein
MYVSGRTDQGARGHVTRAVLDLAGVTSESPPAPERGLGARRRHRAVALHVPFIHTLQQCRLLTRCFSRRSAGRPASALLSPAAATSSKVRLPPTNNIYAAENETHTRRRKNATSCWLPPPCESGACDSLCV